MATIHRHIESVKVKREVDDDPDFSYLGEYTDKFGLDHIDVESGEFIRDLPCRDCDKTEAAHWDVPKDSDDCIDFTPDVSYRSGLYNFWKPGPNHIPHNPANWEHVQGKDRDKVIAKYGSIEGADRAYAKEDFERCQAYNRNEWCYVGVKAEASIVVNGVCQTITSGGLWGIESDSKESYFKEVADEQLAELRDILRGLGFSKRQVDKAIAEAETVEI